MEIISILAMLPVLSKLFSLPQICAHIPIMCSCAYHLIHLQVPFKHADEVREYLRSFVPDSSLWQTEMLQVEGFPDALPVFFINLGKLKGEAGPNRWISAVLLL